MAVTIIKQPVNITAIVGTTAKFAVIAEGDGIKYNWQIRKPTDTNWAGTSMTGSKTPVLEIPAAESRNGYMYRCVVYDADNNSVTSDEVTLTVINVGFVNRSTMQGIADAIRAKTETTGKILPADMAGMIEGLRLAPDGISEIELVTCAGSGTYTLTVPCGLSDTPTCVAIYSAQLDSGAQRVTSGIWVYDKFVVWYGDSSVCICENASPLRDGALTIKAYANSTTAARFTYETYICVMWR